MHQSSRSPASSSLPTSSSACYHLEKYETIQSSIQRRKMQKKYKANLIPFTPKESNRNKYINGTISRQETTKKAYVKSLQNASPICLFWIMICHLWVSPCLAIQNQLWHQECHTSGLLLSGELHGTMKLMKQPRVQTGLNDWSYDLWPESLTQIPNFPITAYMRNLRETGIHWKHQNVIKVYIHHGK